jgi:transcriptional regulator with XRE-family HTH domain
MSTVTKDEAMHIIGANIRKLMAAQNYGIRELARDAEANHMTISRLVNEVGLPSPEVLWRVAQCLGVALDDLFRKKIS